MEAALNQPTFLTQAQALLVKAICKHTTQRNAEVKSIINKDRQVAPKRMQLGARLAVNTHNMGGRFVESVKNARWSMRPQEAGDGLESMVEFQVQIKGHNQREYEDKWQGWQNWTDEKLATKLRMTSWSCYYQPGGGLTRCWSWNVEDGGKVHTSE